MSNREGGKKRGGWIRRAGYYIYLLFAVLLLMEIGLRIYNPFHLRLKGDRILLPINQRTLIVNRINPKLDSLIVNTRNSLGFRGPEPSADRAGDLSIITIGGSTTECHFLNDDRTWPAQLGKRLADSFNRVWVNNAGMDGHSTFGHLIMLNDHVKRVRPRVILFLTGINDVESDQPSFHDKLNTRGAYSDLRHYLFENSEVLNVLLNLARGWRAQKFNNTTNSAIVLDSSRTRNLAPAVMERRLAVQGPYLATYRSRLERLADTCVAWGILPVFLTQPNLFGAGKDPVTGVDLRTYPADGWDGNINGQLMWEMLEKYNDVTRALCVEKGVPLIDLARLMPKNSLYFYDMSHFTNPGAAEVAEQLSGPLEKVLSSHFPQYKR